MKYLFLVRDEAKDTSNLYSVEAESLSSAQDIITHKFMPYFNVNYEDMVSGLNDMQICIEYIDNPEIQSL